MRIFLTGGMGFIGSHTAVELLETGHEVTLFDNLSNASEDVTERIQKITGKTPLFIKGDIRDEKALKEAFAQTKPDVVIHFAGLKAVGESCEKPLTYYDNNVNGTVVLLKAMREAGVFNLLFSSSCTVYGTPQKLPITEDHPVGGVTNPYGRTKLIIEKILQDLCAADKRFHVICLRYFNPIGAHPSGLIGENPNGIPNNLLPYVARVASGKLDYVRVFGDDYPTKDGTGVRDYIHVVDLARGHVAALSRLKATAGCEAINLGTGTGYSVLEIIKAYEKASGRPIAYKITPRRAGDVAANWADPTLALKLLGWKAQLGIEAMCRDSWNFETQQK